MKKFFVLLTTLLLIPLVTVNAQHATIQSQAGQVNYYDEPDSPGKAAFYTSCNGNSSTWGVELRVKLNNESNWHKAQAFNYYNYAVVVGNEGQTHTHGYEVYSITPRGIIRFAK